MCVNFYDVRVKAIKLSSSNHLSFVSTVTQASLKGKKKKEEVSKSQNAVERGSEMESAEVFHHQTVNR